MENRHNEDMEETYNRRLEKDFVDQLKGRVKRVSKEELRRRVIGFLQQEVLCTLATCSADMPRATVVRYRSHNLTVYILSEGGGKIKNIRTNPNVSISLCGPYSGFQSVKGMQAWGRAEVIDPQADRERYREALRIMNLGERDDLKSVELNRIPDMYIIKIDIVRARYLDFPEGILNQVMTIE
jgi:nitroimidazol reductase NimA-like FMN-containing flavoprotein (pyridoxamine 5'-phosphate oxidase superfamily)